MNTDGDQGDNANDGVDIFPEDDQARDDAGSPDDDSVEEQVDKNNIFFLAKITFLACYAVRARGGRWLEIVFF